MPAPIGLYFEEIEIGAVMETRGRTITEADLVQFAGLTGDYNPMHTDAEYMKSSVFGQRIAHGMLTLSYAVGQAYQLGFMERTVIAFRGLEMKFSLPVFIGDTHPRRTGGARKNRSPPHGRRLGRARREDRQSGGENRPVGQLDGAAGVQAFGVIFMPVPSPEQPSRTQHGGFERQREDEGRAAFGLDFRPRFSRHALRRPGGRRPAPDRPRSARRRG